MPKCPKCEAQISYLLQDEKVWNRYRVTFDVQQDIVYEQTESFATGDTGTSFYSCPECCADLFTDEEEVVKFLRSV